MKRGYLYNMGSHGIGWLFGLKLYLLHVRVIGPLLEKCWTAHCVMLDSNIDLFAYSAFWLLDDQTR